jgi:uncharacterized protein (DUF4415 family)
MTTEQVRNEFSADQDGVWGVVGGVPITEDVIGAMVANAEVGFPGVTPRRTGRPLMGKRPARTVAVRLDPDLDQALLERVAQTGQATSDLLRDALRKYLAV